MCRASWRRLSRRDVYREAKRQLRRVFLLSWRGTRAAFEKALRRLLRWRTRAELLRIVRRPALAGLLLGAALAVTTSARADVIELSAIEADDHPGGFSMDGIATFNFTGTSVSSVGDINGDDLADLVVGAPLTYANGTFSGTTYVVFGKSGGTAVNLENIQYGIGGFAIHGLAYSQSGHSISGAGDINGDAIDDIIVAAPNNSPNGEYSGTVYVVFGKSDGTPVQLSDVESGTGGFAIHGVLEDDRTGSSVSAAGDVNGDGRDDIVIGAYAVDGNGTNAGITYVVFGKSSGTAIELSDLALESNTLGFQMVGAGAGDRSGYSVSGAGDVNGDGKDDIVVGAPYDDMSGASGGAVYVVFGKATGTSVALASLQPGSSTAGFVILGEASERVGKSVSGAGDVNGDGLADVIVGAPYATASVYSPGVSYVVFGKPDGAVLDLADVAAGTAGLAIFGAATGDQAWRCSGMGDINGDGLSDLAIGAPDATPNGTLSGRAYVVFGKPGGNPVELLSVEAVGSTQGFAIDSIQGNDRLGASIAGAGDVDGDGILDVIVGASWATRNGNNSGAAYVVFGRVTDLTVWADFAHNGTEDGKFHTPFDTLTEAIAAVPAGGVVKIKGDTAVSETAELLTLTKPMTLESIGGKITIGAL